MASQRMQYLQEVEHRALELADELQEAQKRIAQLEAAQAEYQEICEMQQRGGEEQAREWDRYWKAAGVASVEISVDEAIARWQEREREVDRLRDENILLKSAIAAIVDIVSHAQRENHIQDHIANAIRTMSDPLDCDSEES